MTKPRIPKKVSGDPAKLVFMVVDDDSQVRAIVTEFLISFGFLNILQAKDGKAALKIIQNHNQRLDFIISDWEMPNIDGLTVLRAVRKDPYREDVKFLMVSSQSSRERLKISEAGKAYVDAYVVKPFRAHILKEKINNLIEKGIDKSSEEFEASLVVPSNEMQANGFAKAAEEIAQKAAKYRVKELVDKVGQVALPPDNYDLTKMDAPLVVNLSKAYIQAKWVDKAVNLCKDAIRVFPDSPDVVFQLAYSYFLKGELEESLSHLKNVTKLKPYHVEAQTLMAEVQSKLKVA